MQAIEKEIKTLEKALVGKKMNLLNLSNTLEDLGYEDIYDLDLKRILENYESISIKAKDQDDRGDYKDLDIEFRLISRKDNLEMADVEIIGICEI